MPLMASTPSCLAMTEASSFILPEEDDMMFDARKKESKARDSLESNMKARG